MAACQTAPTSSPNGTGYRTLTPLPETTRYIIKNDRSFAEQVGAHNTMCRSDKGCI